MFRGIIQISRKDDVGSVVCRISQCGVISYLHTWMCFNWYHSITSYRYTRCHEPTSSANIRTQSIKPNRWKNANHRTHLPNYTGNKWKYRSRTNDGRCASAYGYTTYVWWTAGVHARGCCGYIIGRPTGYIGCSVSHPLLYHIVMMMMMMMMMMVLYSETKPYK